MTERMEIEEARHSLGEIQETLRFLEKSAEHAYDTPIGFIDTFRAAIPSQIEGIGNVIDELEKVEVTP